MNKIKSNKRLIEADLITRYPHIVAGSLRYDEVAQKQKVTINTFGIDGTQDGNTREIATSDLHQCRWTSEVKAQLDKLKAKAKRAFRKAAKEDAEPVVVEGADTPATGTQALADALG